MSTVIFNGSPRNKRSNSSILANHFIQGYEKESGQVIPQYYLADKKDWHHHINAFLKADCVLFIFPLYTDCMPGIQKEFMEEIYQQEKSGDKKMGFIVQSGFPESVHSEQLERYLKKFTLRMDASYLGTIIKGGVEGIQIMPPSMTKKLFFLFETLGKHFAKKHAFNEEIGLKLAKPYKMSFLRRSMFRIFSFTGLSNFYWNSNLKKNNAYHKRFDKPYQEV